MKCSLLLIITGCVTTFVGMKRNVRVLKIEESEDFENVSKVRILKIRGK